MTTIKKDQRQQLGGIGHDNNEKVEGTIELQLKSHSKIFNLTKFFVVEGEHLECDIVIGRQFCLSNSLVVDPKNKLISQVINDNVIWSV